MLLALRITTVAELCLLDNITDEGRAARAGKGLAQFKIYFFLPIAFYGRGLCGLVYCTTCLSLCTFVPEYMTLYSTFGIPRPLKYYTTTRILKPFELTGNALALASGFEVRVGKFRR